MRRRKFLGLGVSAAAAGPGVSCSTRKTQWRFFTADEARTIEAICEQIVPADQDPGAAGAGVVNYIDRQLAGFLHGFQKIYRDGIVEVDLASQARFGARFASLNTEQQASILSVMEKYRMPFFDAIVAHTMQGFYGSPRHGGNRDGVSWKMLGVPFPPVRGRA